MLEGEMFDGGLSFRQFDEIKSRERKTTELAGKSGMKRKETMRIILRQSTSGQDINFVVESNRYVNFSSSSSHFCHIGELEIEAHFIFFIRFRLRFNLDIFSLFDGVVVNVNTNLNPLCTVIYSLNP